MKMLALQLLATSMLPTTCCARKTDGMQMGYDA